MSEISWNWDPIPRMPRTAIRTVRTGNQTTTYVKCKETMDDVFDKLRTTAELYRQQQRCSSKPIERSFKYTQITVSSEESDEPNDTEMSANREMTSTPQHRLHSCAKPLQPVPNIVINRQTSRMTPIRSPNSSKAFKRKKFNFEFFLIEIQFILQTLQ